MYFNLAFIWYPIVTVIPLFLLKLIAHLLWVFGYYEDQYHDMICVVGIFFIIEFVFMMLPEEIRSKWLMTKKQKKFFWITYFSAFIFLMFAIKPDLVHLF